MAASSITGEWIIGRNVLGFQWIVSQLRVKSPHPDTLPGGTW